MVNKLIITTSIIFLAACTNQSSKKETLDDQDLVASLAAVFGETKQVDPKTLDKFPLGSQQNPVRTSGPQGQRDYVSRLICDNSEQVSAYARVGSGDIGPYGTITDIYTVICDTNKGAVNHTLYLDMYHESHVETRPATGFIGLKPPKK